MKSFFLIFVVFSLSSCAVASLTTTAVKVAEVPFKVVGSVLSDEEDKTEEEQ